MTAETIDDLKRRLRNFLLAILAILIWWNLMDLILAPMPDLPSTGPASTGRP